MQKLKNCREIPKACPWEVTGPIYLPNPLCCWSTMLFFWLIVHISCIERDAELVPLVLWRQFILTTSSAPQICQASNVLPTKVEAFKSPVVWSWKQGGGNQSQRQPCKMCVLSLSHKSQELSIEFGLYLDVGPFLSLAATFNVFL